MGLIYNKASIIAQGLPEPSSLRGSTLHYITLSAFQTPPTHKVTSDDSTITCCFTSPKIFKFMDTTLSKPIFYMSIVEKPHRARDLLNLKVVNYGMTYRRQFEFIGGNTLFKENSNFIY